jgi:hypothetical protein
VRKMSGGEIGLEVVRGTKIEQLRTQIIDHIQNASFESHYLSHCRVALEDVKDGKTMTVEDYKIEENSTIFVLSKLRGGI